MKYFGVMITSMKHLMRLLKVSLIALTLVICVAIARRQMSGIINNAAQRDYSKQNNELNQDMTTSVSEILPTVAQVDTSPAQSVADSSGMKVNYQPVKGSGQVVKETVAAGNSASQEYDFPENIYPYRAMLTDNQKLVYDQVYEAVDSRTEEVILCRQLDQTGIANVMEAIFGDHPEFFWLDTAYTYGYTSKGTVVKVMLSFNVTVDTFQTSKTAFLNAASTIINNASQYGDDIEKEKSVYMQLQNLAVYDASSELNQSAYSALVNQSTVCAGYARAFQYIMQKLNVPCYFCSGTANGGNHAWNIVCIDGKYYNVDLSWDDTLGEAANQISYSYFNLSDRTFGLDHKRSGLSLKLPNCVVTGSK